MRAGLALLFLSLAAPLRAGDAPMDCAAQAGFVVELVQGRRDGTAQEEAEAAAQAALDVEAGAMLVQWIYSLPEDQLTEAVGTAWKAQCEAL